MENKAGTDNIVVVLRTINAARLGEQSGPEPVIPERSIESQQIRHDMLTKYKFRTRQDAATLPLEYPVFRTIADNIAKDYSHTISLRAHVRKTRLDTKDFRQHLVYLAMIIRLYQGPESKPYDYCYLLRRGLCTLSRRSHTYKC